MLAIHPHHVTSSSIIDLDIYEMLTIVMQPISIGFTYIEGNSMERRQPVSRGAYSRPNISSGQLLMEFSRCDEVGREGVGKSGGRLHVRKNWSSGKKTRSPMKMLQSVRNPRATSNTNYSPKQPNTTYSHEHSKKCDSNNTSPIRQPLSVMKFSPVKIDIDLSSLGNEEYVESMEEREIIREIQDDIKVLFGKIKEKEEEEKQRGNLNRGRK